jgi:2-polyprenyl-3-methyl-5-hydroxy-6-metoxy-1,4-benzoquinol methylase
MGKTYKAGDKFKYNNEIEYVLCMLNGSGWFSLINWRNGTSWNSYYKVENYDFVTAKELVEHIGRSHVNDFTYRGRRINTII